MRTAEQIIESLLEGAPIGDAIVRIHYFDPERRANGQTVAMPSAIARDKIEAMRRQNPAWKIWTEDGD